MDKLEICETVYLLIKKTGNNIPSCVDSVLSDFGRLNKLNRRSIIKMCKFLMKRGRKKCDKCGTELFALNKYKCEELCRDCLIGFDREGDKVEYGIKTSDAFGNSSRMLLES